MKQSPCIPYIVGTVVRIKNIKHTAVIDKTFEGQFSSYKLTEGPTLYWHWELEPIASSLNNIIQHCIRKVNEYETNLATKP